MFHAMVLAPVMSIVGRVLKWLKDCGQNGAQGGTLMGLEGTEFFQGSLFAGQILNIFGKELISQVILKRFFLLITRDAWISCKLSVTRTAVA